MVLKTGGHKNEGTQESGKYAGLNKKAFLEKQNRQKGIDGG